MLPSPTINFFLVELFLPMRWIDISIDRWMDIDIDYSNNIYIYKYIDIKDRGRQENTLRAIIVMSRALYCHHLDQPASASFLDYSYDPRAVSSSWPDHLEES